MADKINPGADTDGFAVRAGLVIKIQKQSLNR
jgi:hypothetical protein